MKEERYKQLMEDAGLPDSQSLFVALHQAVNETEQECNTIKHAIDILRREMKDKSEGEYYHAWMCNIKFAVYDSIDIEYDHPLRNTIAKGCEEGTKMFLDRLLAEEVK